ncbi:MAG TPA: DUF6134 family protein [Gemmataceae bacterium]|jgi:hypothetical protein|nr:DUF6134 family protein [Gemmataceae bacterium]
MLRLVSAAVLTIVLPIQGEERTFTVTVDGKPAGEIVLEIQKRADGSTVATMREKYQSDGSTHVSFDFRGMETWKESRVVRLEGIGSENGRKGGITLIAGKDAYSLKAGVKEVSIRDEVWPTTGVMPPIPDRKTLVVEAISGDVLQAKIKKIGADSVDVAGKAITTTHYRVTAGASRWDVWYDENNCLAKRSWVRDGRTVIAHLTQIKPDQ